MNLSAPIRHQRVLEAFEAFDSELRRWSLQHGSNERKYPTLIDAATLTQAGYPEAFPHLLMRAAVIANPEQAASETNVCLGDWCLSPAVCYHAFAELQDQVVEGEVVVSARGTCFRNEEVDRLAPGRRQVEFEMRELILIGSASGIESRLAELQPTLSVLADAHGLETTWCPASDPFFLPSARGKALMQRLQGTKLELCLPCGLAVASINRHGTHLTERFAIRFPDGSPAHSACVAFGLDRWIAHFS